jgi:thymidylate synthase
MKTYEDFTRAYVDVLRDVYTQPEFSSAPRGMKIKEILGYQFKLTNPRNRIPYVRDRELSIHYLVAELLWYLSGNDSTEWIANYSAFWSKISDDGRTANSAYGARIFKPHARIAANLDPTWTQWNYVIQELKSDPDSRRAVIHIRSPQDSIQASLDVPCTLSLQFFLREDKVHMVTSMRSSDVILGLVYDVPAFTLFQELLALQLTQELGRPIGLGTYTHLSASLHVYERHYGMVEKILANDTIRGSIEMPAMPCLPPVDALVDFERKSRSSSDPSAVSIDQTLPDYWQDWCKVLASHRAYKLGDAGLSNELLTATRFEGYRYFAKS